MKRQTRWAGVLATAATIWVLGPAPRTFAQAQEKAAAGLAAQAVHVVEPAQPPSIGAVVRELPLDVWRFVSLDTAVVLAAAGGAAALALAPLPRRGPGRAHRHAGASEAVSGKQSHTQSHR